MSQAIADANELHNFANQLKHYRDNLENSTSTLKTQFASLGDTWRDAERERFENEFEETVRVINQFIAIADEQIPFLHRKAERIEDYINQR